MKVSGGLFWSLIGMLIVAAECYALGSGRTDLTLSHAMRAVRFDPIGRFVLLPLWVWLTVHWLIAPQWLGSRPDWRSVVAVLIGFVWAILETSGIQ